MNMPPRSNARRSVVESGSTHRIWPAGESSEPPERRSRPNAVVNPIRKPARLLSFAKKNANLEHRLAKAERVIDIQGKAYALLRSVVGESADQMDLPPWNKS